MSAERKLLAAVGSVLTAAGSIAKITGGPRLLLAKLGWDLPPGVDDIGLAGLDIARVAGKLAAWTTLEADPGASTNDKALALAELAGAVVEVLADLGDLHLQAPQEYLERTRIKDEFLTRLFDLYLMQSAAVASRPVFDVALLLGWFELQKHDADPSRFQVGHLRHVVHWDRVPMMFSDPAGLLRETYGWGTAAFDANALVIRLGGVLQHLAAEVRHREIPAIPLARLHGGAPPAHPPLTQLFLPLIGSNGPVSSEAGLSVFGLPPTTAGAADGGVGIAPYAKGAAQLRAPLSSTLSVGMSAKADLGTGLALLFRPDRDPELRTGLNEAQAGTGGAGAELQLDLTLAKPEGSEPVTLLEAGGARIEARSVSLALGAIVDNDGTDATLRLQFKGARLTVTPDDLPFLQSALPDGGFVAEADADLSWSHRRGIRLDGRAELKTSRTIGRRIGPVTLDAVEIGLAAGDGGVALTAAASATVKLGPVSLTVEQIGLRSAVVPGPGSLGSADLTIRPTPPSGIGIVVESPVVTGGGFLSFDHVRQEYSGIVQLEVAETISVKGIALLTRRMPDGSKGFSLVVLVSAEGFAPIQLGLGFSLTGVGGLLGVNRTVGVDVLRAGIKNGTLGSILFPSDPIRNAPQIVSDLRSVFPPARDRYVFGPMALISWGTPTILTLELALLLEVPEPIRLAILGRLQALLPGERNALVRVRMDAVGVIDFNKGDVSLDATLYDSCILQFALTGDMALRANWGNNPNFVLALGGFNPRFPAPAGFPRLGRLALSLSKGDGLRLRCEAYLALTSNTVQFGARVDLHVAGGGFTVDGHLGLDALFHFDPFEFVVDISAGVALRYHGHLLMGITLDGTLSGPGPWHVRGKASFKVLFFKVSVSFDQRFGAAEPPPLPPPVDVLALLLAALNDSRNWSSELPAGEHPLVTLREAGAGELLRVHPRAELAVRQRVVPLNVTIDKFGNAPVSGERLFTVAAVRADGSEGKLPVTATTMREAFGLAQFVEMSDDEKLARASFEARDAGLRFGTDEVAYEYEAVVDGEIGYETQLVVPGQEENGNEPAGGVYRMTALVLEAVAATGAAGQAAIRRTGNARYR